MKGFGKIIFGIFVVIVGMLVYNRSKSKSIEKALKEQVVESHKNDDYSFFHEYYEYYKEDPVVQQKGLIAVDEDTRPSSEETEIKFDLYIYSQAIGNKKNARNIVTLVLANLEMENPSDVLNAVVKTTKGEDKEVIEFNLQKIDEELNVYFTSIYFEKDSFDQLIIYHTGYTTAEPIFLYDSGAENTFMSLDDYDIAKVVKEEGSLVDNNILKKTDKPFKVSPTRQIITLSIYVVVVAVVTYLMYFKQKPTGPIVKTEAQHRYDEAQVKVKPSQENVNIKNITETEERDDVKDKK